MRAFFQNESLISLDNLQEKTTRIFALLAGILLILLGLTDLLMGLSAEIVLYKLIFATPYVVGYFLMRKYGYYQLVLSGMMAMSLIIIGLNYFYNDGFNGPTVYTIFMLVMTITILFNKILKYIWLVLAFLFFTALIYSDVLGGVEVISNYSQDTIKFWDHVITILWCSMFVFFGIQLLILGYRKQNMLLTQVMEENKQANKELEALNTKKNELIALLSHDLKNPISTLSQTVELVEEGGLEQKEFEYMIQELKKQSFHLNSVLGNTLGWVLTELNQGPAELVTVNLEELNKEMVQTMEIQAEHKGQKILTKKQGDIDTAILEEKEIKIILKNLLDNAIKFSPAGAPVELDLIAKEGFIRWEVKNEGPQIPNELREGLFEFKVRTSYGTNKEKGTGIGLPLCKRIADNLEMKLGFESFGENKNVFYLERRLN